jgi:hypothetical protein
MVGSAGRIAQYSDKSSNFAQGGSVVHLHIQNVEIKNRRARKSSCVNLSRTTRPRSKNTQRDRKRDHAMLDIVKTDEEVLAFDVSDEALEIAAGAVSDKAKYTLGACTGLSVCPG